MKKQKNTGVVIMNGDGGIFGWKALTAEVESDGQHYFNAILNKNGAPLKSIRLGIRATGNSDYRDIQIQADDFHFSVGQREMSVEDFQSFEEAY